MTKKLNFLKNSLLGLFFITLFSFSANAQWTAVGAPNFTTGGAGYKVVQVYNDTVYVAYADGANASYLSVMRYDGTSWTLVGTPGFSSREIYTDLDFRINDIGELYVAYQAFPGITVMNTTMGVWANVGAAPMSNGSAGNASLAFDSTNTPYVAYFYGENIPTSAEIQVQKFDGSNWIMVGNGAGTTSNGSQIPNYPDLEFDANGNLYIAYTVGEAYNVFEEFDGSTWSATGTVSNLAAGKHPQLIFDSNQKPYMSCYKDNGNNNDKSILITPETFISGAWEFVGGHSSVGGIYTDHTSVAIDDNDGLYIIQTDVELGAGGVYGLSVYTYDGTNWGYLGNNRLRVGNGIRLPSSVISNNVLYVAFTDTSANATVEKYDLTTSINQIPTLNKDISIYPNPTKEQLTIEGVEGIELIRILTIDGKVMETITTNSSTISVEALPQGIYTIEVITTEGTGYKNFIKQ